MQAEILRAKISEAQAKRRRYQEIAAEGLIDFGELREMLSELDEEKKVAERETESLQKKEARLDAIRCNKDDFLDRLKDISVRQVDSLSPDERRRVYQIVGLRATTKEDGTVEVEGDLTELCFGILEPTSPSPS